MPNEVYNLAAQSHVAVSFENPIYTTEANNLGTISLLEAIKNIDNNIRFYQASSSEMFGGEHQEMLNEDSPLVPKSPYAVSKVFSYHMTKIYRESYGIFATNGILFNHESPHRGETFVTRKITRAVGRIAVGIQSKITLGNIDASRDWGFAGDYVEAMWKILNHDNPDDWVIATGQTRSVKQMTDYVFNKLKLNKKKHIFIDKKYFRPEELKYLRGDSTKAKKYLKWKPNYRFEEMLDEMIDFWMDHYERS